MSDIGNKTLSIHSDAYDDAISIITLSNGTMAVKLTNLGGSITAINVPDRDGVADNVVAAFTDLNDYRTNPHYYGCILGRFAGRIGKASFPLDGRIVRLSKNDGPNHLHGGTEGFNKKIWKIRSFIETGQTVGVVLEYLGKDGEEGYPGNLRATVAYTLNLKNNLQIVYEATTDKSTPVSLANHSYFNLSGFKTSAVLGHNLQVHAACYTEKSADNIPTGRTLPVHGTSLDFRQPVLLGAVIGDFAEDEGLNHNFAVDGYSPGNVRLAAILSDPASGRSLNVYTDQPGLQVYTANDWRGAVTGPQGLPYVQHGAIALETQSFPDAPNHPEFPSSVLRPGQRYFTTTIFQFTAAD